MKTINFAIVGYGGIAKTHALGAYAANIKHKLPFDIRLSHIVTRRPLERVPYGAANVIDLEEVLQDPNIDFIDICTPNDSHMEIARAVAKYGKAIYCEKPLASSYDESLQMLEQIKGSNIHNGVAFNYRFMPAVYLLKQAIEKQVIGDIIDCKATLYHDSYLNPNKKGAWRTKANQGGGALLDLGIHLIDLIHYTMGEIREVQSDLRIFFNERTEVDEIANCDFVLENGVIGRLEVSRVHALHHHPTTIEIFGTKGSVTISSNDPYHLSRYEYKSNRTTVYGLAPKEDIPFFYPAARESLGFFQDTHMSGIIDFCNQICGYPHVGATFEDGVKAQKIVHGVYMKDKTL